MKNKKILYGGLALLGVIAVISIFSYTLKERKKNKGIFLKKTEDELTEIMKK